MRSSRIGIKHRSARGLWPSLRSGIAVGIISAAGLVSGQAAAQDDGSAIQVYDTDVSFEKLLSERKAYGRNPAALTPMARVIGVRRDLGLNDLESSQAAQDIVLNGGTGSGLSEGMVLAVVRKIPVIDPYQANQQSELEVEFAKVRIIHAQSDVAVARLESIDAIGSGLALGTRSILVGDFITSSRR